MKVGDDNESDKSSFAEADRVDYASILNPEKYHFSIEKACVRPVLVVSIYSYKLGILFFHLLPHVHSILPNFAKKNFVDFKIYILGSQVCRFEMAFKDCWT